MIKLAENAKITGEVDRVDKEHVNTVNGCNRVNVMPDSSRGWINKPTRAPLVF